jgi:hypothetical protein
MTPLPKRDVRKANGCWSHWLVRDFIVFGIPFQNWMPMMAGIVLLFVLYLWVRERM